MPPVTPNYDLGPLITIDISIGLLTVLAIMIGVWASCARTSAVRRFPNE